MNLNKLVERVKKLLLSPTEEWKVIKGETQTVAGLFTHYVLILCAIPAVASFIGWSIIGYGGMGPVTYRVPIASGAANMVLSYILNVGAVYALALVIDHLAPNFRGEKNFIQALKVAAFFPTSAWVCGVFYVLPSLTILAIVGALYSLWLLYTGLAPLMEVPEQNVNTYTTIVMIAAIGMMLVIAIVTGLAIPSNARGF